MKPEGRIAVTAMGCRKIWLFKEPDKERGESGIAETNVR
jgi:hypothetical protein